MSGRRSSPGSAIAMTTAAVTAVKAAPSATTTTAAAPGAAESALVPQLELRGQLRLQRGRHRLVVAEGDGVAPLAAGQRIQPRLVAGQLRQGRLRQHRERTRAAGLRAAHLPAP